MSADGGNTGLDLFFIGDLVLKLKLFLGEISLARPCRTLKTAATYG